MKPVLYTTHCPKCKVLEAKLKEKKVDYDIVDDKKQILEEGIRTVPVLVVNGARLDFLNAVRYVNELDADK